MSSGLQAAQEELVSLLAQHEMTKGLYVRARGKHLTVGREVPEPDDKKPEADDRVRLTHLSDGQFGLSVMRHTGKWEKTPFCGTLDELVGDMRGAMQHLLAPWP